MDPDGYRNPPQLPLTFTATADSIKNESQRISESTKRLLDHLVATISPVDAAFDNVLKPLAEDEDQRNLASGVLSLYHHVSPDASIRQASEDAEKIRDHFILDCWTRHDVFRLVDAIAGKNAPLQAESRKFLSEWHREYIRKGVALDSQSDKDELTSIQKRLNSITTEFSRNLDEEGAPVVWLTVEQLSGLPEDRLHALVADTDSNKADHAGKIKVVLEGPIIYEFLRFVRSPEARKEIFSQRHKTGLRNVPLFEEAVSLRHKAAKILGFPTHADFRLESKMAKTSHAVLRFLKDILERALPYRDRELDALLRLKLADIEACYQPNLPDRELFPWDVAYYRRIQAEKAFSVNHRAIAEYFPVPNTVAAMLALFGDLFGFVFVELYHEDRSRLSPSGNASDLVWHEDVKLYSVWNASDIEPTDENKSSFIGYLYLDLYHRSGKYGGLMCYPIELGFTRPDARHYPSTLLLTSFPPPIGEMPTLLRHDEVVTLFHELGHGIHDLSGRSRYTRFHGAQTVGDFNEAPSQMLENWCWTRVGLQRLSSHYKTEDRLPDDMIDSLLRTKKSGTVELMALLKMSLFDMDVHGPVSDGSIDVAAIYQKYRDLGGIQDPEDKHLYATYRHLFLGYDAGMYNYLWAKAHAMDMFDSVFKQDLLNGETGRRYRHMVLEKGATQDEMKTLTDFLGRDPKPDAFLADLGLA